MFGLINDDWSGSGRGVLLDPEYEGLTASKFCYCSTVDVDRDSSIGITTCYGLCGPGIESHWGPDFLHPFQSGPVAHPTSYTMATGSSWGDEAAGAWC